MDSVPEDQAGNQPPHRVRPPKLLPPAVEMADMLRRADDMLTIGEESGDPNVLDSAIRATHGILQHYIAIMESPHD